MAAAGDTAMVCSAGEQRFKGASALGQVRQGVQCSAAPRCRAQVGLAEGEVVLGPVDTAGEFLCLESGHLRIADISLVLGGQGTGVAVRGGGLTLERVKVVRGEVALRAEGSVRWRPEGCRLTGSGVAVEAAARTEGRILD